MNTCGYIFDIIFAGLSVIVAALQLSLSKKISNLTIAKERGLLLINDTNIRKKDAKDYDRCVGLYDLRNAIHFSVHGGDIFVIGERVSVNGSVEEIKEKLETYFPNREDCIGSGITIPVSKKNGDVDELDVIIEFKLKNMMGYEYLEMISLSFEKKSDDLWELKKKNTVLKDCKKIFLKWRKQK
jgi:hypothetical protein